MSALSEREELEAKVKSLEAELEELRGRLSKRDLEQARELEALTSEITSLDATVKSLETALEKLNAEHAAEADRARELSDEARRAQAHVQDLRSKSSR